MLHNMCHVFPSHLLLADARVGMQRWWRYTNAIKRRCEPRFGLRKKRALHSALAAPAVRHALHPVVCHEFDSAVLWVALGVLVGPERVRLAATRLAGRTYTHPAPACTSASAPTGPFPDRLHALGLCRGSTPLDSFSERAF